MTMPGRVNERGLTAERIANAENRPLPDEDARAARDVKAAADEMRLHGLFRRSAPVRPRIRGSSVAGRVDRVLRAADRDALRELQRGDLAHATRAAAGI